jgi:outer membrane protein OmpA-like peptidoglycan-associated protein
MPSNITFAVDSERFDNAFYPVLDSVAKVLSKFEKTSINVDGYTDSTGSFEYNQMLSERRAAAVSNYLRQVGVDALRIATRGFGERYPLASNETDEGRAQNRRVEIWIRGAEI